MKRQRRRPPPERPGAPHARRGRTTRKPCRPVPPLVIGPSSGDIRTGRHPRWATPPGPAGPGEQGNQTMDALDLLLTRETALKLDAPAPSEADLDKIFQSAGRAPDHGRLRPWRFVVIKDD